LLIMEGSS